MASIISGFDSSDWLTIIGFIGMSVLYIVNSRVSEKITATRLELVDANIEDFKIEIKKLAEVITEQAVQSTRLTLMENRMLAEGARLDSLSRRLNAYLDGRIFIDRDKEGS